MKRRMLVLAALTCCAAIAAGCGGSASASGGSVEDTSPLTHADLVSIVKHLHRLPGYRSTATWAVSNGNVGDVGGRIVTVWDRRSGRQRVQETLPAYIGLGVVDVVSVTRPSPAIYAHFRDLAVNASNPLKTGWLHITGTQARSFVDAGPSMGAHYRTSENAAAWTDLIALARHGAYDGPSQVNGSWATRYLLRIPITQAYSYPLFKGMRARHVHFIDAQIWVGPNQLLRRAEFGPWKAKNARGLMTTISLTTEFSDIGRKPEPKLPPVAKIVEMSPRWAGVATLLTGK